jgi:3-oxoacyl-[acyl-carrier-protein] synthase III
MPAVEIAGTGAFLPGEPVSNDVVEELFGSPDHYVSELLGMRSRYWATDPKTFEPRYRNSEMAAAAGTIALEAAGLEPAQVDLIVVNSSTPDYPLPPMGTLIQERLGIEECGTVELRSGCVGAVTALAVATEFLRGGMFGTALVITSDLPTAFAVVPLMEGRELSIEERMNGIMFGDGAGAVVLRALDGDGDRGGRRVQRTLLNSIGVGRPPGMTIEVGGSAAPVTLAAVQEGRHVNRHDYRAVQKWGRELSVRAMTDLCTAESLTPPEIDLFLFPQANPAMLKRDREALDLLAGVPPERMLINVDTVGNTVSAGLLIGLDGIVRGGDAKPGARVALIAGEASKWMYGAALVVL